MRYQTFFEIELTHPYTQSILDYVAIIPDASTANFMNGTGLLLKGTESGCKLFAAVKGDNNTLPTFQANTTLVFSLFARSGEFREFTDFSTIGDDQILLFSNDSLGSDEQDLLVSGTSSNEKYKGFPKVGEIKITLDKVLPTSDQNAPNYKVGFDSRSMIWKYYFITKDETAVLSIKNKDILFKELSDEATDTVFNKLTANFSPDGLHIEAFESEEALALQSSPRKDIQLKNENTTIINHLPNPEIGDRGIKIIRIN
ncbi:MAG: hypothetical protein AB8B56_20180 [Crocinitomicaceae bacterium]